LPTAYINEVLDRYVNEHGASLAYRGSFSIYRKILGNKILGKRKGYR